MRNTLPRRLFAALILATLTLLSACSSPPAPPPPPVEAPAETHGLTKADLDAWLDGKLPDVLTKGKATGAVVTVVKDGEILTMRGYGHAKRGGNGQPATPVDPETTIFRWGSISKVPTAIAAMQLVEQGKLDLDADIATYTDVPIRKHHKEPITLRHLLTHTAGFEESIGTANPALKDLPLAEFVRHNPPVSVLRPGTTPAYSNYGITLAGYIIEQASGQPFQDYVKEHVLAPAGMTTASYDQPLPEETLALAYDSKGRPASFQFIPDVPAGTLAGSGVDAAAFMLTQLNQSPDLLTEDSWNLMWTPALDEDTLGNFAHSPRMGLGYWTRTRNGHRIVEHGGDTEHYHSQFEIYPDDQVGIFVSFVDDGSFSDAMAALRDDLLDGFADRYLAATSVETPQLEGSTERAQQVAGDYIGAGGIVTTWLSAWNGMSPETIRTLPNGNLFYRGKELTEIAPWTWKNPHADGLFSTLTARVVDGRVELGMTATTLHPITATQQALLPVFIVSLVVLALVLVSWLIGAIQRWRQARVGQPRPGLPRLARIARLGALGAATALVGWLSVLMIALIGRNFDLLGNIALFRTLQVLQWAGIAAIIPAGIDLVSTLRTRAGWRRTTMAALLLAALLATAWWAITGNVLNPNLGL